MILEGKIDVLFSREGVVFEIHDDKANVGFLRVTMTPEQWTQACSRLMHVDCVLEVRNLEKAGKTHENKEFEFEITPELRSSKYSDSLTEIANSKLTDGWRADGYFGSQNSFFTKDGKQYAKCTIRRWI